MDYINRGDRVELHWAPSQLDLTHDKEPVIDRHVAAVMTLT